MLGMDIEGLDPYPVRQTTITVSLVPYLQSIIIDAKCSPGCSRLPFSFYVLSMAKVSFINHLESIISFTTELYNKSFLFETRTYPFIKYNYK